MGAITIESFIRRLSLLKDRQDNAERIGISRQDPMDGVLKAGSDAAKTPRKAEADCPDVIEKALQEGWLSAEDSYDAGQSLKRQTAARILHEYIRIIKGVKDLPDISAAEELKDLYDCRLCVNHIAQVYLRGLMKAKKIPGISDRGFLLFDQKGEVTEEEAAGILVRLEALSCSE